MRSSDAGVPRRSDGGRRRDVTDAPRGRVRGEPEIRTAGPSGIFHACHSIRPCLHPCPGPRLVHGVPIFARPIGVALLGGQALQARCGRGGRVTVFPQGVIDHADVHSEEGRRVPGDRRGRVGRAGDRGGGPVEPAQRLLPIAERGVALGGLQLVERPLRVMGAGGGQGTAGGPYDGRVPALLPRDIALGSSRRARPACRPRSHRRCPPPAPGVSRLWHRIGSPRAAAR